MAFPAALYTQTQLQIAVGGADKLLQLADRASKTGQLQSAQCQSFLTEVSNIVSGEVNSILQCAFDPHDPTYASALFVQEYALTLGVYWAWHKSTGGLAVPEEAKDAAEIARAALKEARDGIRSLGTDADPASNQGTTVVTIDSGTTRVLRQNMGGFC